MPSIQHFSGLVNYKKETRGFEPLHAFTRLTVFETVLFSHLSMSPFQLYYCNKKTKERKAIIKKHQAI